MHTVKHTVELHVRETWARHNGLAWTYAEIAEEAYEAFHSDLLKKLPKPPEDEDPEPYYAQQDRMLKAAIKTIVFAAMSLEASIYDLAAIHLTDDYVKQYLDKLDLLSKWLVIPRLLCGKSLDEQGPAIQALRGVIKSRNSLVHHKSIPVELNAAAFEKARKSINQIGSDAHVAYQSLVLASLELHAVLGVQICVLPPYESTIGITRPRSAALQEAINRCRQIHGKHAKGA